MTPARRALLLAAVPAAFVAVFFAYPVAAIVGRGLVPGGHPDLSALGRVVTDPRLRGIAWFTVAQAALSTALTLVLGLPGAHLLARVDVPGRSVLRALVVVPFVLPTMVVGTAFRSLFGPGAPMAALGLGSGVWAIVAAHVFFNHAVVVRTVGGLWAHLDPRQEEAARTLGAGRIRTFCSVTLPQLRPAIVSAASIVFLFCFTSFGIVLVLGGPRISTLETEIYRQTAELLNLRVAAALSVVQLVAVVAALAVGRRARGRREVTLALQPARRTSRRPRGIVGWAATGAQAALVLALVVTPLVALVARSVQTPKGLGWDHYRALAGRGASSILFASPAAALAASLRNAVAATAVAVAVGGLAAVVLARRPGAAGGPAARRRGRAGLAALDTFLMLPLGVSAVTVGFGFLIALDRPPLDLRTSPALIPLAHALVAAPLVVRALVPVLESIDPHLREAAGTLGASPLRVWREVDLPIVARALLVGAGLAFAVSLGEFGATLFIARPDTVTLPVLIFRLLSQPGPEAFGQAMAASSILMVLTAGAMLLVERIRVGEVGAF